MKLFFGTWIIGIILGLTFSVQNPIPDTGTENRSTVMVWSHRVYHREKPDEHDLMTGLVWSFGVPGGDNVLDNLTEGVYFTVTGDEVICRDGFVWWKVRLPDGREGYIAEGGITAQGYFVDPYPAGVDIFEVDAEDHEQLNHYFVDTTGTVQIRFPLNIPAMTGTAADLWQSAELSAANQAFNQVVENCPGMLKSPLAGIIDINTLAFSDTPDSRIFYSMPESKGVLLLRHFTVPIPDCNGTETLYGTTYVSLVRESGEINLFQFSQHNAPPESFYCQSPLVPAPEQITRITEIDFSKDGRYVALVARYLGSNEFYPCAFYHVFVVDSFTTPPIIISVGEGQQIVWQEKGNRIQFFQVHRTDPNIIGETHLITVLPDGTDPIEIALPDNITWIPGVLDSTDIHLPWASSGQKVLACQGITYECSEMVVFDTVNADMPVSTSFLTPLQPGLNLAKVAFIAGDKHLLWLGIDGDLYQQDITEMSQWEPLPLNQLNNVQVVDIQPFPAGLGALLHLSDGRYFYYDVSTEQLKAISLTDMDN